MSGNVFRMFGGNFFGGCWEGRESTDTPQILGDVRYLNVWFPADWTNDRAEEWRELHGLSRKKPREREMLVKPKPGLII
jgi:hypothetical protein